MAGSRPPDRHRFHPEHLFRPRSVALLGVDTQAGETIARNLARGGFKGAVHLLAGTDAAALPETPDLALIADADDLPRTLAALGARGCRAAIVVAPAEGVLEAARAAGVRVLGPTSFGLAVPPIGLDATLTHLPPVPGRTALVSQSAALCRAVLDWAGPNGVGFSHVVGIGDNADFGFGMVLDWLSRDPDTGVILLDISRIKDRRAFVSAARAASRLRPVVALRAGGRLLDPEGDAEAAFTAALARAGVVAVEGFEDLLAAAETLSRARPALGETLAIVTNAGGPGRLAADAALRLGIALTPPRPAQTEPADPAALAALAGALAATAGVGGVLAILAPTGPEDAATVTALIDAAPRLGIPLLVCVMGETNAAAHRRRLAEAGLAVFATPEQAVRGFVHLLQHRRTRAAARELPPRTVLRITPDRAAVTRAFAEVHGASSLGLAQEAALGVLAAYGVPVAPTRRAIDAEGAAAAAAMLGWPVALKLPRETSDAGAIRLDLGDADAVRAAARILDTRRGDGPAGFIVQRQAGRARELLIRVTEDALIGPVIGFGQGGTAADLVHDVALDLPPLNLPLARALIARPRVAATLGAFRDQAAANREAIAETLVRISQLVVDFPEIAELTVNPLFADADGVLAADAWIRLRPSGKTAMLAVTPYPAELARRWATPAGEPLLLRPIRPEDAEAHGAFFRRLAPEDVRYRFFSPIREISPEQMARLTQVDYAREMAFVAVRDAPQAAAVGARGDEAGAGETVGVARLVRETGTPEAEFAVVVQPDIKGRGVARALMQCLFDWARAQGITEITGQVLADNVSMLAFVRKLGFALRHMPDDEEVVEARLTLTPQSLAHPPASA